MSDLLPNDKHLLGKKKEYFLGNVSLFSKMIS